MGRSYRLPLLAGLLASAVLAWAQTAPAQPPLGSVTQVNGLVTMGVGSRVTTVDANSPVFDGTRFVSGSSGSAEIRLSSGCTIQLAPNQMVTIDQALTCPEQTAAVSAIPESMLASTAQASTFTRVGLPLLTAAALVGAVARIPEREITPLPK